ncbi:major facilitator superfamily permease 2 [Thermococcus cleftensis]|uniref:Major facilitator superfamily permease 2 n=1 Tax=Thermococcus cleftensis (strain DSM 27260 / KACC 17922 / CL1) TaxID=163003 RepID=I3ZSE6_THECF|nr:MFS transporter [Thermococcus cleftensis]AFL94630.1 major facilitator superfamily permease 2 [Thermococcus cleftensis]
MKSGGRGFQWGVVLSLALLGFSRSVGWALNKGLSFPLLSSYTESAFVKGTILAIEGLIGLFIPVLLGYYSDTLRSRHGRRRPFIMVGGLMAGVAVLMIYTGYAMGVPLWGFALTLGFFYLSMHVYTAQYRALMPDTVESGHRGKASGVITLLEWAGNLFLFGLAGYLMALAVAETGESEGIKALAQTPYLKIPFIVTAAFLIGAALFVYFIIREPEAPEIEENESLWGYLKSIVENRDFLKFYAAQTLWWMSFEFIAIFLYGILAYILHGSASEENIKAVTSLGLYLMALFNVTVLLGALPGGIIYDRLGRRLSIIVGGVIFALPQIWGWFIHTEAEITIALGIAGIGWGILMAASYPVIGDLLTRFEREAFTGRYYGFFEATRSLPVLLAGTIGGAIVQLAGENYRVLFPIGALLVLLAMPMVWFMKNLEVEGTRGGTE